MKKLYLFVLMLVMSGCSYAPGFSLNGVNMPETVRSWTPGVVCDFIGGCLEEKEIIKLDEFDEVID